MNRKIKTIKLKQGSVEIPYAKVSERVKAFHGDHTSGSIRTEHEFIGDAVMFKARVIPDVSNGESYFTGSSFGKFAGLKGIEKLETVAVGRALAMAGYLSEGEIASEEEMEVHYDNLPEIDLEGALNKLTASKTIDELATAYRSLSQIERDNAEVKKKANILKAEFIAMQKDAEEVEQAEITNQEKPDENTRSGTKVRKMAPAA